MLLKILKNKLSTKKNIIKEPIFIKDFKETNFLLEQLEKSGEKRVYFELKNSFLPIICLHNLNIIYNDYETQIDFLIVTQKFICILETQKLSGNLIVNDKGEFIRNYKNGETIKEEGMYSPITKNERHIRIIKELLSKKGLAINLPIISMVVMTNPTDIINEKHAPSRVKDQLLKYDQIVSKLKDNLDNKNTLTISADNAMNIAKFILENHTEKTNNYIFNKNENELKNKNLIEELKQFRLEKSREEHLKPYFVFTNKEMEKLIEKHPKTKDELIQISGFGEVKVKKYGDKIIEILS